MEKAKCLKLTMAHHMGICSVCGVQLKIAGGPDVGGYRVSAHHHADLEQAKKGALCSGSDKEPKSYILARR